MNGNSILVGVGPGDEQRADAIARAVRRLATGDDDRIVLVHVYAEEDRERIGEMLDVDPADAEQMAVAARHNTAVRAVADALEDAVEPAFRGEFGDPGSVLVDVVAETEPDFLVVGGRKRSPAGKALLGSTAQRALLSAACPVVFVKRQGD